MRSRFLTRVCTATALLLVTACPGALPAAAAQAPAPVPSALPSVLPRSLWQKAFTFADERINESSGLAASVRHPGVVWTINDGAGPLILYAVGPDGRTRATLEVSEITGIDPEGMSVGVGENGAPLIFIGDTGSNPTPRPDGIIVYQLVEPARLADGEVSAVAYRFVYPDEGDDCETVMVDPRTGRFYFVTKTPKGGALYRAPEELSATEPNVLSYLGEIPLVTSDGVITPKGHMILRGYGKILVWDRPMGRVISTIEIPQQPQGEGIALSADATELLISSEKERTPVWRMKLPAPLAGRPSPTPAALPAVTEDEGISIWWGAAGGLVLLGLAVAFVFAFRAEARADAARRGRIARARR